jgi:hypothetical protein
MKSAEIRPGYHLCLRFEARAGQRLKVYVDSRVPVELLILDSDGLEKFKLGKLVDLESLFSDKYIGSAKLVHEVQFPIYASGNWHVLIINRGKRPAGLNFEAALLSPGLMGGFVS